MIVPLSPGSLALESLTADPWDLDLLGGVWIAAILTKPRLSVRQDSLAILQKF